MFHLLGPIVDHTKFIQHNYAYAQLGESSDTAVTHHSLVLPSEESETLSSVPAWEDNMVCHKQLTPEEIQRVKWQLGDNTTASKDTD